MQQAHHISQHPTLLIWYTSTSQQNFLSYYRGDVGKIYTVDFYSVAKIGCDAMYK